MAIPTFVASGSPASGTGTISPALPAGIATGDILLLAVETRGGQASGSLADSAGGDWTLAGDPNISAQQSGSGTSHTRITAYLSRYNGTQTAPTVADSGDHQLGVILAFRGVVGTGSPHEAPTGGADATADTTLTAGGTTTTGPDRLAIILAGRAGDNADSQYSNWANADLANLQERVDIGTTAGAGGGIAVLTGEKAAAGTYGNTTADVGISTTDAWITFALISAEPSGGVTGSAALTITFGVGSSGTPKAYGSSSLAVTTNIGSAGTPKAYASSSESFTFGVVSAGTIGSSSSSAFTFGVSSSGTPKAYGASASAYTFTVGSSGTTATTGASSSTYTFSVGSAGTPKAYGAASTQTTVNISSAGSVPGSGSAATDITFGVSSSGTPKAYGSSTVAITVAIASAGSFIPTASSTLPITFGVSSAGTPKAYAASSTVISFNVVSAGVGEITTGMFDDTGPAASSYDEPSPTGSHYDAPALIGAMYDEPNPS